MSTILITSSGFLLKPVREEIIKALPAERPLRVAYIPIASAYVSDNSYALRDVEIMGELGIIVDEVDLETVHAEELEARLRSNDFIYVQGGNPYLLLKHIRESGFDKIAPRLIEEGMPYVGKSAGAYILAPEVIVPKWIEDEGTGKNPWHHNGVEDVKGMGVVPFVWAAHFTEEIRAALERHMAESPYPVRAITNDQAFLVTDDEVRLVGIGEEVKLEPTREDREGTVDSELKVS